MKEILSAFAFVSSFTERETLISDPGGPGSQRHDPNAESELIWCGPLQEGDDPEAEVA